MDLLDYKDEGETSEYAGMYPKFRRRALADELLGALKNQVQHFSERMLHGKNLQSVEC